MNFLRRMRHGDQEVHEGVLHGDLDRVQVALQSGISVNKQDKDLRTPLHCACAATYGVMVRTSIVGTLLTHHAQTRLTDKDGHTALHVAAQSGCVEVVRLILGHRNPETLDIKTKLLNDVDLNAFDALMLAAAAGHLAVVMELVEGANLRRTSKTGMTAFLLACEYGHASVASFLAARGADLDARVGHTGVTALHLAARNGDLETVEWLARSRPTLMTATDNESKTPWHWARDSGQEGAARRIKELSAGRLQELAAPAAYSATGSREDMRDAFSTDPLPSFAGTAGRGERTSDGGGAPRTSFTTASPSFGSASAAMSPTGGLPAPFGAAAPTSPTVAFGALPSAPLQPDLYPSLPENATAYY